MSSPGGVQSSYEVLHFGLSGYDDGSGRIFRMTHKKASEDKVSSSGGVQSRGYYLVSHCELSYSLSVTLNQQIQRLASIVSLDALYILKH